MNKNYVSLRKKLNKKGNVLLKKSQIDWLKTRNAECVKEDAVIIACAVKKTRERVLFLKERLYECNKFGCMNELLGSLK